MNTNKYQLEVRYRMAENMPTRSDDLKITSLAVINIRTVNNNSINSRKCLLQHLHRLIHVQALL